VSPCRVELLEDELSKHLPQFSAGQDFLPEERDTGLMDDPKRHGTGQQEDTAQGL